MIDDNIILEDLSPKPNRVGWLVKDLSEIKTLIEDINERNTNEKRHKHIR